MEALSWHTCTFRQLQSSYLSLLCLHLVSSVLFCILLRSTIFNFHPASFYMLFECEHYFTPFCSQFSLPTKWVRYRNEPLHYSSLLHQHSRNYKDRSRLGCSHWFTALETSILPRHFRLSLIFMLNVPRYQDHRLAAHVMSPRSGSILPTPVPAPLSSKVRSVVSNNLNSVAMT